MPITRVTGNVIKDNTLTPDDFSQGKPLWNTTGYLTATTFYGDGSLLSGVTAVDPNFATTVINVLTSTTFSGYLTADAFIGDGSQLTNIQKSLSVIEVTDNLFFVESKHNNTIILLNSLSTINIDVLPAVYTPGHLTYFIQNNVGRGKFEPNSIYSSNSFYETKQQYSVCKLLNFDFFYWTLYGDLTSTSLTSQPPEPEPVPVTILSEPPTFTDIVFASPGGAPTAIAALSGTDLYTGGTNNAHGELGQNFIYLGGGNKNALTKVLSANFSPIRNNLILINNPKFNSIAGGRYHFAALSGTDLYTVGSGYAGQLGLNESQVGYYANRSLFTKVPGNWTNVWAGGDITFALSGGDLYFTGVFSNIDPNGTVQRSTFTRIRPAAYDFNTPLITDAKYSYVDASTGSYTNTVALSGIPGDLYVTGRGNEGQLGIGSVTSRERFARSRFVRVLSAFNGSNLILAPKFDTAIISDNYCLALSGTDLYATGRQIPFTPNSYTFFTKMTGSWTQLTHNRSGYVDEAVLALSGTDLYVAGSNYYGRLGTGDTINRSTFTKVPGIWNKISADGDSRSIALSANNTIFVAGITNDLVIFPSPKLTFTQITGVAVPV